METSLKRKIQVRGEDVQREVMVAKVTRLLFLLQDNRKRKREDGDYSKREPMTKRQRMLRNSKLRTTPYDTELFYSEYQHCLVLLEALSIN